MTHSGNSFWKLISVPIVWGLFLQEQQIWRWNHGSHLETNTLKPQISVVEGGVQKRILERSLKKSLHSVRHEVGFEWTRSVTPTELPFNEWRDMTLFASHWQVTPSHRRLPSKERKRHIHFPVAKPPWVFLKQRKFDTQGIWLWGEIPHSCFCGSWVAWERA